MENKEVKTVQRGLVKAEEKITKLSILLRAATRELATDKGNEGLVEQIETYLKKIGKGG